MSASEMNFYLELLIQELDSVCYLTLAFSSNCSCGPYSYQAVEKEFSLFKTSTYCKAKGSCNSPSPKGGFLTCTAPADRVQLQWQEVD